MATASFKNFMVLHNAFFLLFTLGHLRHALLVADIAE
jgi:hypothetical protein